MLQLIKMNNQIENEKQREPENVFSRDYCCTY